MASSNVLAAAMAVVLCGFAAAQNVTPPTLNAEPTAMLGDRIRMRLPEGSVVEPRDIDRFSNVNAVEDLTVATCALGDATLRFEASMTFLTAGDDFKTALESEHAQDSEQSEVSTTELIRTVDGFRFYLTTWKAESEIGARAALASVWAVHPDGIIEVVHGTVSGCTPEQFSVCQTTVVEAMKTVAPGPAECDVRARTVRFGPSGIEVDVPDGYAATTYLGPDFWVHRVRKVVRIGQSAPSFGIYDGWHPGTFRDDRGTEAGKTFKARLFGEKVKWYRYRDGDLFGAEALFGFGKKDANRKLHVFCTAYSEAGLDELLAITGTLRFVDDSQTTE